MDNNIASYVFPMSATKPPHGALRDRPPAAAIERNIAAPELNISFNSHGSLADNYSVTAKRN